MQLRPYQQAAIDAVYDHLRTHDDNPCIVMPTGTGKGPTLAKIATDAVTLWNGRVIILAHVKELLEQNADKVQRFCPDIDVGIYSAGLKRRDTDNAVIVASIQSVYKRATELGHFDIVIVDEAHLIPTSGDGQYRTFLEDALAINPLLRVIGLTATPYRMQGGLICQPDNILNQVCYDVGIKEMIADGYLTPLRSKAGKSKAKLDDLHMRGGEFVASEMEAAMDQSDLVRSACSEIVELTRDRQAVLIFCTSVAHCRNVVKEIERISGMECGMVTGDTPPGERAALLARIKGEDVQAGLFDNHPPLKYLANVNVLTTGFDATNVDCVVLLRPTASPGLYVQMVGRGTRLHPGKTDCLILDYGGNVLRHGPVDAIDVCEREKKEGNQSPVKECPECHEIIAIACRVCPQCDHEFPLPEQTTHESMASSAGVLSGQIDDTDYEVRDICYSVHEKRGAPPGAPRTMRVEYRVGWHQYISEWVCPEHTGYARSKFTTWWLARTSLPPPANADEAVFLAEDGALATPTQITVRTIAGEKFDRVIKQVLGEKPDYVPEPGWNDAIEEAYAMAGVGDDDYDLDDIPF